MGQRVGALEQNEVAPTSLRPDLGDVYGVPGGSLVLLRTTTQCQSVSAFDESFSER